MKNILESTNNLVLVEGVFTKNKYLKESRVFITRYVADEGEDAIDKWIVESYHNNYSIHLVKTIKSEYIIYFVDDEINVYIEHRTINKGNIMKVFNLMKNSTPVLWTNLINNRY